MKASNMLRALMLAVGLSACAATSSPEQGQTEASHDLGALKPLAYSVGGRASCVAGSSGAVECTRQWPGTYFETAVSGGPVFLSIGAGDAAYKISVDGEALIYWRRPAQGVRDLGELAPGPHVIRVDVVNESQGGPSTFGGFFAPEGVTGTPVAPRAQRIEFIGDSMTVGYGNTSSTRTCSQMEIWMTTDTSLGVPALVAARYGADYRVNAISGRGIVRNYGGFIGDPLPTAYASTLFDHTVAANDAGWDPQVIVVGLGANDFSTPLNAGEKWADRAALQRDYENSYVAFLTSLRAAHPNAYFVLWNDSEAGGEVATAVTHVLERVRAAGETRIAFTALHEMERTGCDWHPSLNDDRTIADLISGMIDAAGVLHAH